VAVNTPQRYLGLDVARDDPALVYPVEFNTKDDGDTESLADATAAHNLFLTAVGTVRALKAQARRSRLRYARLRRSLRSTL
jgi:hypothetical protein